VRHALTKKHKYKKNAEIKKRKKKRKSRMNTIRRVNLEINVGKKI
jgi:hypothetical protein